MKERLIGLDASKGIAILLVSFGHILDVFIGECILSKICYFIELPIFFMASGIQFRYNEIEKRTTDSFLKKRLSRIMYPYLTFSIFYIIIEICKIILKILIGKKYDIGAIIVLAKQTLSLWGIGALWFLPTILIAEILLYILCKSKLHFLISILIAGMCCIVNANMIDLFHSEPIGVFDHIFIIMIRILLAYVFEYIGYCIEPLYLKIISKHVDKRIYILCNILIICSLCLVQFNIGVNMRYGYIGNPIIEYVSAIVTMMSIMILFYKQHNKYIMWLAKNSLVIMALQSLDVNIAYMLKNKVANAILSIPSIVFCLISLGIFILVAVPLTEFINKYLKFLIIPICKKKERN